MCSVDGYRIDTSIKVILDKIKDEMRNSHTNGLDAIVDMHDNNVRVTCPFHKNGQERTPSCDILLEKKGKLPKGTVHCFGCGYRANLIKFVADCLHLNYREAKEWLLSNTQTTFVATARDVDMLDDNEEDKEPAPVVKEVPVAELRKYDYIHDYMFERKLTYDIIHKFEVGYDPATFSLTFPVYYNGVCEMVVRRYIGRKGFHMPKVDVKPIFGLDYIDTQKDVIVCESIIDALTCWVYGRQAIALLGTGSTHNYELLNKLNIRSYTLMLDGDDGGRKGVKRFKENILHALIYTVDLPDGKDVNDLTLEEFNYYCDNSSI